MAAMALPESAWPPANCRTAELHYEASAGGGGDGEIGEVVVPAR